jgi:hypothetical protein
LNFCKHDLVANTIISILSFGTTETESSVMVRATQPVNRKGDLQTGLTDQGCVVACHLDTISWSSHNHPKKLFAPFPDKESRVQKCKPPLPEFIN